MCKMSQESYQGIRKQFHIRKVSLDVNVCVMKKEKERHKKFPRCEISSLLESEQHYQPDNNLIKCSLLFQNFKIFQANFQGLPKNLKESV